MSPKFKFNYVISRTPARVSFAGGGTDLRSFYKKAKYGQVISATIDKYIYVTVKRHGDLCEEKIRLSYKKIEVANKYYELENNIARECLKYFNITEPIYISVVADIPVSSGLGSSSCFTVGLLNAIYKILGKNVTKSELAQVACKIEINALKNPIGKQDQYAATYGGLNIFKFLSNEKVIVKKVNISKKSMNNLINNSILLWTGYSRSSYETLKDQKKKTEKNINLQELMFIREQTKKFEKILKKDFTVRNYGEILEQSWEKKKNIGKFVTNTKLNSFYKKYRNYTYGGKICGAGNGGFFLFALSTKGKKILKDKIKKKNYIDFKLDHDGSKIIFVQ